MALFDKRVVAIDLEGDGNQPPAAVELAVVEVSPTGTGQVYRWLVDPGRPISRFATRIHGLSNADLVGAPGLADIADKIQELVDGSVLVGHNIGVDLEVLQREIPDIAPAKILDTLKLAKAVMPGLPSYALTSVAEALHLAVASDFEGGRGQHSAAYDAVLSAEVFLSLIRDAGPDLERRLQVAELIGRRERSPRLL